MRVGALLRGIGSRSTGCGDEERGKVFTTEAARRNKWGWHLHHGDHRAFHRVHTTDLPCLQRGDPDEPISIDTHAIGASAFVHLVHYSLVVWPFATGVVEGLDLVGGRINVVHEVAFRAPTHTVADCHAANRLHHLRLGVLSGTDAIESSGSFLTGVVSIALHLHGTCEEPSIGVYFAIIEPIANQMSFRVRGAMDPSRDQVQQEDTILAATDEDIAVSGWDGESNDVVLEAEAGDAARCDVVNADALTSDVDPNEPLVAVIPHWTLTKGIGGDVDVGTGEQWLCGVVLQHWCSGHSSGVFVLLEIQRKRTIEDRKPDSPETMWKHDAWNIRRRIL